MNIFHYIGIFFGVCFLLVLAGGIHAWADEYRDNRKARRERELKQAREDMEDMLKDDRTYERSQRHQAYPSPF